MEVVTQEKEPYQERVNEWCFAVPPKCSKYKLSVRMVNKTQILKKERVVFECCGNYRIRIYKYFYLKKNVVILWNFNCLYFFIFSSADGYAKSGTACLPICVDCKNGVCVGPDRCKCSSGYFGPACDISMFVILIRKFFHR